MNGRKNNVGDALELEVIHTYSRQQAIEDGTLIDVTETAREVGFKYPVALTWAVWCRYVCVPDGVLAQDEVARLWDLLWMTKMAIQKASRDASQVGVWLSVRNDNHAPSLVMLKAQVRPGDDGEPVITVMMRCED